MWYSCCTGSNKVNDIHNDTYSASIILYCLLYCTRTGSPAFYSAHKQETRMSGDDRLGCWNECWLKLIKASDTPKRSSSSAKRSSKKRREDIDYNPVYTEPLNWFGSQLKVSWLCVNVLNRFTNRYLNQFVNHVWEVV